MAEDAICATCGTEGTLGQSVRRLTLPDPTAEETDALHLCQSCLSTRSTKVWHAQGEQGKRLRDSLESHTPGSGDRYSYLEEPGQRLHLMRLRPGWVDAKHGA